MQSWETGRFLILSRRFHLNKKETTKHKHPGGWIRIGNLNGIFGLDRKVSKKSLKGQAAVPAIEPEISSRRNRSQNTYFPQEMVSDLAKLINIAPPFS